MVVKFDDVDKKLEFVKKVVLQKFISVGTLNKFQGMRSQLYWENSIDLIQGKPIAFSTFRLLSENI